MFLKGSSITFFAYRTENLTVFYVRVLNVHVIFFYCKYNLLKSDNPGSDHVEGYTFVF